MNRASSRPLPTALFIDALIRHGQLSLLRIQLRNADRSPVGSRRQEECHV